MAIPGQHLIVMKNLAYADLESRFRRILTLRDAGEILQWDYATIMPSGGASGRADQLAELEAVRHGLICATETGDLLDQADQTGGLEGWQSANLAAMKHMWGHATALSEQQVTDLSRASSACETVWRTARAEADFAAVLPSLEKLVGLVRDAANAKSQALGLSPYDALLDEYEPGGRSADIDQQFKVLEDFLPGFLNQVLARQGSEPAAIAPKGPFPEAAQRALGIKLMEALGFDFDHGRLDTSLHPFCGGTSEDVRITTRYDENDYSSALMGVLHETGHALYERGLPADWRYQPVGDALGMATHESQSLLVEMQVCRSRPFLEFAAPLMAEAFGGSGPAWSPDNLYKLLGRVDRSFIRVDADEVTYPLHVILRYRLERAVIGGDLKVGDLPAAWNDGMEDLLGVRPPNDAEGCLQDIHWYDGAWGYFPTYTLGAMTAAQLFAAAKDSQPDISQGIPKGDFKPLMGWLGDNVHGLGSSIPLPDLLTRATGRPLDAKTFIDHLKSRYLPD